MADGDDQLWDKVYAERSRLFEQLFGPMPDEVYGSWNFPPGSWPGGSIIEILGNHPGDGLIASTFGLTNPGLVEAEPSIAGYGFEILVCTKTKKKYQWPLKLLHAVAWQLLQTDFSFLPEINRFGGSFIDRDFLVVPGFARVPRMGILPNGTFHYLVVLPIAPAEHALIHARPMVESLPKFLETKADEWVDEGFIWKRSSPSTSPMLKKPREKAR